MKKIAVAVMMLLFLGVSASSYAQDSTTGVIHKVGHGVKKGAKKVWKGTKKGAKTVGNETAELATKAKGEITDKTSDEWVGPNGQKIYVDDGNKYYWVSEKGKKMFVTKSQMKAKQ